MSWIVTREPEVILRLRTEFKEEAASIVSMKQFVKRITNCPTPSFEPSEKKVFLTRLAKDLFKGDYPSDFIFRALRMIELLKSNRVYPEHINLSQKKGMQMLSHLYATYEREKPLWDDEDGLNWAMEHISNPPQKAIFLMHDVSELERHLIESLSKTGTDVSYLKTSVTTSTHQLSHPAHPPHLQVCKTQSRAQQIALMVEEIKKCRKQGIHFSEMFIYVASLEDCLPEMSFVFSENKIPFGLWRTEEASLDRVSIFPLSLNRMVFGKPKVVWVCGLENTQEFHVQPSFGLTEDEKIYFNEQVGKNVFETSMEYREKVKSILKWQLAEADHATLLFTKEPSSFIKDFLSSEGMAVNTTDSVPRVTPSGRRSPFRSFSRKGEGRTVAGPVARGWDVPKSQLKDILPSVFSARSLGQFQKCPYGFLIKECFKIKPQKGSSLELASDEEGALVHDVLYGYFKEGQSKKLDHMIDASIHRFQEKNKKNIQMPDLIRLKQTLFYFIEVEKTWQNKSAFIPKYFELSFGMDRDNALPLSLLLAKKRINIRGKIDRVDVDESTKTFKIIDYKTGTTVPSQKDISQGKEIQLSLYALAVQELFLPAYFPKEGSFYLVKQAQQKNGFRCETESDWLILKQKTIQTIFQIISDMEKGEFPKTPDNCYTLCELRSQCEG